MFVQAAAGANYVKEAVARLGECPGTTMRNVRLAALLAGIISLAAFSTGVAEEGSPLSAYDLATLRDISSLSVSPDGNWAAFAIVQADPQRNLHQAAWHLIALGERNMRRLTDAGDLLPVTQQGRVNEFAPPPAPAWSPDSRSIAYLKRERDRTQIWHVDRNGGRAQRLTSSEADVREVVYARDGLRILFETEPSRMQIEADLMTEGLTGFRYDQRFQPLYHRIPVYPSDTNFKGAGGPRYTDSQLSLRRTWAYELSSGRERPATSSEMVEFAELATPKRPERRRAFRVHSAQSRGGALAWAEARDSERQGQLASLTVIAQLPGVHEPTICAAVECTDQYIAGLWWRSEKELIFIRREGPRFQDRALYSWRPRELLAPRLILRTHGLFAASRLGCDIAQERLVCLYEQSTQPARLVAIDLDSGGALETVFDPNPDFTALDLGPAPRRIVIRAASGADTYGYLALPPRRIPGERLPLVIVTYRCSGFLRGGVGDEYPVYPLTAEGFAVLCYDLPEDLDRQMRLEGGAYARWERGPGYPVKRRVEETLVAAVAQLDAMGVVDPGRVGVTGLSFGAEIVGFALPHMPALVAAISSGSPGPSPNQYYLTGPVVRDLFRTWGLGAPDETPDRWRDFAFTPHIPRVRASLLVNVADRELLHALEPVVALEDAGRAVEMYVFPDEYHIKWQPAHRLAIYERNIDWMNFWLRGVEDPDPAKAAQYARWRGMRVKQCELFKGDDAPWYCRR